MKITLSRYFKIKLPLYMKKYYLTLCFLFFSCYQQERNCLQFQTGTFEFESTSSSGKSLKTYFTRTKDIEVDYFNNTIDSSYVTLVSDCECILKKINPKNLSEEKSIQMKILSTSLNEYTFEYSYVGDIVNKKRGRAKKINNKPLEKITD